MRAMVIETFGGPEGIHPAYVHPPEPADTEALIEIACAGVNPDDWKMREGMRSGLLPPEVPVTPGWAAAAQHSSAA